MKNLILVFLFMLAISVQAQPDITITKIYLPQTTISAGGTLKSYVWLGNLGTEGPPDFATSCTLSVDAVKDSGDKLLAGVEVTSLAPGINKSVPITFTIPEQQPAGQYYLIFYADPANLITELDEDNNSYVQQITIDAELPDLFASQIDAPVSAYTGVSFGIHLNVYNAGQGYAGASTVRYYVSKEEYLDETATYLGYDNVSGMGPEDDSEEGAYLTVPTTYVGLCYIFIVVDADEQVPETNENNNFSAISISFVLQTDLLITDISGPEETYPNTAIQISTDITNTGPSAAPYSYLTYYLSDNTAWDDDDTPLNGSSSFYIDPLSVNETRTTTGSVNLPPDVYGRKYIIAKADATNLIEETDEVNNTSYAPIGILSGDLVISDFLEPFVVSGLHNFFFTVKNVADTPANSSVLGVYKSYGDQLNEDSDLLVSAIEIPALGGKSYTEVVVVVDLTDEDANVAFKADLHDVVAEAFENNNVLYWSAESSTIANQITVFPNPASQQLNFQFPQNDSYDINIISIAGESVLSMNIQDVQSYTLGVSALEKGIYSIRITTSNFSQVSRLIIQ